MAKVALLGILVVASCGGGGDGVAVVFTDVTLAAGIDHEHADIPGLNSEALVIAGGAAAGDYDGDGWLDLYVVGGTAGRNRLYRNRGDGTFLEVGESAGVAVAGVSGCGPSFADYDGDGDLDLFVGGVADAAPILFRNDGDGTFTDVAPAAGLVFTRENTFSAAWGDYDRDGDLDLFTSHWKEGPQPEGDELLWRNNGDGTFTDVSGPAGIEAVYVAVSDHTFTPNFADVDGDGWPDLLVAGDFLTSDLFLNNGDGTFRRAPATSFTDENGMGAAVGDYDNDGDLDWFVSSIYDADGVAEGDWGITGNRFYRNRGDGTFEDVTDAVGVRDGWWGWGSSFADFDLDGHLDLVHVNGFPSFGLSDQFEDDPTRLFLADGAGGFREAAVASGLDDMGQGRGLVCFDYDRDGDLDLFIANNREAPRLFRNDTATSRGFLGVRLVGRGPNTQAIGARIRVTAGGVTQVREVRAGNNFVSANPAEERFGLGGAEVVDELRVAWPDGTVSVRTAVAPDQILVVVQ
jgi:hypothetical protein